MLSTHVRIWKPQLILKQSNFLYLDKPVFLSRFVQFSAGSVCLFECVSCRIVFVYVCPCACMLDSFPCCVVYCSEFLFVYMHDMLVFVYVVALLAVCDVRAVCYCWYCFVTSFWSLLIVKHNLEQKHKQNNKDQTKIIDAIRSKQNDLLFGVCVIKTSPKKVLI